ncbi:AP-1 complex subunit gamma-1 [Smittium mucronatum]|uniref:AP-1 complex subunit gamma n=1 Tax=Smittium mucronatum TaxID=133383 RepID=A0A1R0GY29_9FUNG|nr:AP-1 complex subunit gamma-1 [Smittium mucronatum]
MKIVHPVDIPPHILPRLHVIKIILSSICNIFSLTQNLIRAIRVSKTAADERSIIQKESAGIRTSFKESNSQDARYNNIQKLLYIYLLGYPVQFGQLECLKLVASSRYSDKRVGYLGVMVLIDENQEIMTLLTNSLKNDLQNADDYIVGLALCTLSNLGSEEASRDLIDDVIRLIGSSRSFIRKKAVIAALRIIRKVPDFIDTFVSRTRSLLGDKNHGVQLSAVALLSEICSSSNAALEIVQKMVPIIVRQLRSLLNSSSGDHEIGGINDPFLQIGLLKLLRQLGTDSVVVADEINDILTQVMTQTDDSKNVGTSVLYECIRVVLTVPSEKSLRVLAINLLGKFLEHKDNNIRYVALIMLLQAMVSESHSVLRVQSTVVQCLRDSDISIRRHALDLTFALVNNNNVRKLTSELLDLLPIIDNEFKKSMTHKLFVVAELFAPSVEWCMDIKLKTLYLGGIDLSFDDMYWFISEISGEAKYDTNLKRYATRFAFSGLAKKLYNYRETGFDPNDKFIIVAVWVLGEFGDLALDSHTELVLDRSGLSNESLFGFSLDTPSQKDVVDLLEKVFEANNYISQVALTSLIKLCGRNLLNESLKNIVLSKLKIYLSSPNAELQTRSVHFLELFKYGSSDLVLSVTDKIPPPILALPKITPEELNPALVKVSNISSLMRLDDNNLDLLNDEISEFGAPNTKPSNNISIVNDLLGLMDETTPVQKSKSSNVFDRNRQPEPKMSSLIDDLVSMTMEGTKSYNENKDKTSNIFGDIGIANNNKPMESTGPQNNMDGLLDLSNMLSSKSTPSSAIINPISPTISLGSTNPSATMMPVIGVASSVLGSGLSVIEGEDDYSGWEHGFDRDYDAYKKNNLSISFRPSRNPTNPDIIDIVATFKNHGDQLISNLNFQVAVPKVITFSLN